MTIDADDRIGDHSQLASFPHDDGDGDGRPYHHSFGKNSQMELGIYVWEIQKGGIYDMGLAKQADGK